MKTAYKFLSILLAGSMLSSCNDLLTETPRQATTRIHISKQSRRPTWRSSVSLNSISDYNHYGQDEMAMPTSDDMYFSSRTQSDNKINDISHYRYNSGNDWVEYLWRMKYQGIDRANTAILGISGMPDFRK